MAPQMPSTEAAPPAQAPHQEGASTTRPSSSKGVPSWVLAATSEDDTRAQPWKEHFGNENDADFAKGRDEIHYHPANCNEIYGTSGING